MGENMRLVSFVRFSLLKVNTNVYDHFITLVNR